jgi:uncharacterized membrane protein
MRATEAFAKSVDVFQEKAGDLIAGSVVVVISNFIATAAAGVILLLGLSLGGSLAIAGLVGLITLNFAAVLGALFGLAMVAVALVVFYLIETVATGLLAGGWVGYVSGVLSGQKPGLGSILFPRSKLRLVLYAAFFLGTLWVPFAGAFMLWGFLMIANENAGLIDAVKRSVRFGLDNLGEVIVFYIIALVVFSIGASIPLAIIAVLPVVTVAQLRFYAALTEGEKAAKTGKKASKSR